MQVDGEGSDDGVAAAQVLSRSPSAAPLEPSIAAAEQQQQAQQHAPGFVPVSALGGSPSAPLVHPVPPLRHASAPPPAGADADEEPSSLQPSQLERPASGAGYESSDDMDMLAMRHCLNCTGPLWGHICMDCGHMMAHDDELFAPTLASAAALHRPRLQGDALTVISWDERMELHEESGSSMHPERPDRVRAVMARLQAAELAGRCRRLPAREATPAEIGACHIPELLAAVDVLSEQSRLQGNTGLHFSPDTYVNQHTAMCAKLSAGACVDVTHAVVKGEARAGVAVVRPPGHHAESNTAMGFCFFNNAGIAARAAQAAGAERVLVLDWDVHHGNGTQHIFEGDASVLYMSLHRYDGGSFYPGTGAAHEVGEAAGEGYSVNVPWPCGGMRNADYLAAFNHVVLPIAYEYAPDLVIISAGFDAAEGDPIGGCHLTPECYAHMAAQLQLVAPTVALLEGGYNLLSTAKGTEAVLRVLLGERPPAMPAPERPACAYAMAVIAQVMRIQSRYWDCMRGLVQQQFKVLAAAAARQEQLAAMKARRAEAAVAAPGSLGEEAEEEEEGEGEDAEEEAGLEMEGLEEGEAGGLSAHGEALLGSLHPHHHHGHHAAAFDALEDGDSDTPHQPYRNGTGWESDADVASGEEGLSADERSEGEEEQAEAEAPLRARWPSPGGSASPRPEQQEQLPPGEPRLGSETLPMSDSDAPGSGSTSDGATGDAAPRGGPGGRPGPAGLTSASLSPAARDVLTPAGEQLLAAARDTPALGGAAAQPAGGQAWKGLTVKAVVLKRPGQQHQRLSPPLVDGEALQLVRQPEPLAAPSPERAVPQQEQQQAS
ncbi:histone deacetylase 15 isoform X1 [Micractinium conductrix]|uniref:histone deacetylase n=1 Tax=Micractinium conductrix TaxID=554055 RepID=A0A2P6V4D3_9CHLO|nr:histone deacetylase 15 isoform X1 [Micractinium conductrix]|eukprot:PSC68929.1 histone deacetylase 15 isoform X1 [Micractinium conductrix]